MALVLLLLTTHCASPPAVPPEEAFATGAVNYPARQRVQLFSGVYDPVGERTYVVYAAGRDGDRSACSPTIQSFDHRTARWSEAVEVFASPVRPDAHDYPQVLLDEDGFLHVFHTFHANRPVRHAVSLAPRDPAAWRISDLPESDGATYGAAFRTASGAFVLFFRDRANAPGERDHEPEIMMRSDDRGASWTRTTLIDPVPDHPEGNDRWGTVYVKSTRYEAGPVEGVHLVFGVHRDHNLALDRHYYAFLRLQDGHVLDAAGEDLGPSIDRRHFDRLALFDHGGATDFYNVRTAVMRDAAGHPIVFAGVRRDGEERLLRFEWTSDVWREHDLGRTRVAPYEGIPGASSAEATLYAIERESEVLRIDVAGDSLSESSLFAIERGDYRLMHLTFVRNARPELRGFFFHGRSSHWREPTPTGSLIAFGDP